MIKQVDVTRFRCFRGIKLDGLKQFNIVVGSNASGKTAFLESIFLASAERADQALSFRVRRGLGEQLQTGFAKALYENLWKDLFFGQDDKSTISIALKGSRQFTRRVTIAFGGEPLTLPLGQMPIDATAIIPIEFNWVAADGIVHTRRPELTERGLNFGPPVPNMGLSLLYFSPIAAARGKETADWFSDLSVKNQETEVVEAVRAAFPYIDGLSIEMYAGQPAVYAKVRGIREKLPLGMISEGVSRILHILVGVASRQDAVVLIDEFENGLYYQHFSRIWKTLVDFCKKQNVQLFATTHSREFIRSLAELVEDRAGEVSLLRARRANGECQLERYEGLDLIGAIEQGYEIR